LDFSGSAAVCFIGHGDAHVAQAVADQLGKLEFAHTSQFVTPVADEFARELLDFAGPAFRGGAVYFTSGGSEAVETALKLARQFQVDTGQPERHQFISRRQSYHGATLGALAVSGNRRRRDLYSPMLPEVAQVNTPYCYRCPYECRNCAEQHALELERAIAAAGRSAAAFICEPVSGATLGAAVPPDGYMQRIRQICDTRGLLWIADEVMTGCGRTGATSPASTGRLRLTFWSPPRAWPAGMLPWARSSPPPAWSRPLLKAPARLFTASLTTLIRLLLQPVALRFAVRVNWTFSVLRMRLARPPPLRICGSRWPVCVSAGRLATCVVSGCSGAWSLLPIAPASSRTRG